MILSIDSGNTSISFALFDEKDISISQPIAHYQISNVQERSAEEYWFWLYCIMRRDKLSIEDVSCVSIASVVPETKNILIKFSVDCLKKTPLVINHNSPDLTVAISETIPYPSTIGADRLVNADAVVRLYEGMRIVVDFGTATTFDIIDANNTYQGGIIAPGLALSRKLLYQATAQLPWIELGSVPDKVVGKSSETAMSSGLIFGYAAMIEGLINRVSIELDKKPDVIICTGGFSLLLSPVISLPHHSDVFLTLRGLAILCSK